MSTESLDALFTCTPDELYAQLSDVVERLELVVNIAHAEALGVRRELHRPLAALAEAGQLDNVLCLIMNLANRPQYVPAALELASGLPMDRVAAELPEGRDPAKWDFLNNPGAPPSSSVTRGSSRRTTTPASSAVTRTSTTAPRRRRRAR